MTHRVDIWHNILWSKYKGAVFSDLHRQSVRAGMDVRFFQIAETENDRIALGAVDLAYHKYPYRLMVRGSYQDVSAPRLAGILFWATLTSPAELVVLAGYHKIEYWVQLLAARLTGKRVMVFCNSTYHDRPRGNFRDHLKRWFFRFCHGYFCYGQRSRRYLLSYGAPDERVYTRCQAAALPRDYDPSRALERRLAFLAEGRAPVILYVGRLAPEKNLFVLLQAFQTLLAARPDCTLRLVGEGPYRAALEAAAARRKLGDKVVFAGSRKGDDLWEEYARATCLVLPSVSEPWGLVVNEALAYGCPVVVSERCGCVPELVLEGKTGYACAPDSAEQLCESVNRLLSLSDRAAVARNCVELMDGFTPRVAAAGIMSGLSAVMRR